MKPFAVIVAVLWILPLADAQDKDNPKVPAPDYFPLRAGAKWHSVQVANGNKPRQGMYHVTKLEMIDGQWLARVEASVTGTVVATEYMSSTAKGVFRHRLMDFEFNPPVCLLKLPVKDGDSWEGESKAGKEILKLKCQATFVEVTVPAGKFKAVKVDVVYPNAKANRHTYWFVDGVGMVKQTLSVPGLDYVEELEKHEPGSKDAKAP